MHPRGALLSFAVLLPNLSGAVTARTCRPTFDKSLNRWAGLGSMCNALEVNGNYVFNNPKANPKSLMDAVQQQSPQLQSMRFKTAELKDHDLVPIANFVRESKNLRSLALVDNLEISDTGAKHLAAELGSLPAASKFDQLDLSGSAAMTDEAVRQLASAGDRGRKCFQLTFDVSSPQTRTILELSNAFCVVVRDYENKAADLHAMTTVAERQTRALNDKDRVIESYDRERAARQALWLQWSWLFTGLAGVALGALAAVKARDAADRAAMTAKLSATKAPGSANKLQVGSPSPTKRRTEVATLEKKLQHSSAHAHVKKRYTDHYTGLPVTSLRSTIIRDVSELHETPRKSGHDRSIAPSSAAMKRPFSSEVRGPSSSPSKRARTPILR